MDKPNKMPMRSTSRAKDDQMRSTMMPTTAPVNSAVAGAPGAPSPSVAQGSVALPVQQPDASPDKFTVPSASPASTPVQQDFASPASPPNTSIEN